MVLFFDRPMVLLFRTWTLYPVRPNVGDQPLRKKVWCIIFNWVYSVSGFTFSTLKFWESFFFGYPHLQTLEPNSLSKNLYCVFSCSLFSFLSFYSVVLYSENTKFHVVVLFSVRGLILFYKHLVTRVFPEHMFYIFIKNIDLLFFFWLG